MRWTLASMVAARAVPRTGKCTEIFALSPEVLRNLLTATLRGCCMDVYAIYVHSF